MYWGENAIFKIAIPVYCLLLQSVIFANGKIKGGFSESQRRFYLKPKEVLIAAKGGFIWLADFADYADYLRKV